MKTSGKWVSRTEERQRLLRAVSFDYLVGGGERKQLTVLYYDMVELIALSNISSVIQRLS